MSRMKKARLNLLACMEGVKSLLLAVLAALAQPLAHAAENLLLSEGVSASLSSAGVYSKTTATGDLLGALTDETLTTYIKANKSGNTATVTITFSDAKVVNRYSVVSNPSKCGNFSFAQNNYRLTNCKLSGLDDQGVWQELDAQTITLNENDPVEETFTFENSMAYLQYKIEFTCTKTVLINEVGLYAVQSYLALNIDNNLGTKYNGKELYGEVYSDHSIFASSSVVVPGDEFLASGNKAYRLRGWKLYAEASDGTKTLLTEGDASPAEFTREPETLYYLEWQYDYALTQSHYGRGSVTGADSYVKLGTPYAISAVPDPGWKFYGWAVKNGEVANETAESTTVTMEDSGEIVALFLPQNAERPEVYVSATSGSDEENHGFSVDSPFASPTYASKVLDLYRTGVVHLAPGDYAIHSTLTVANPIHIVGEGRSATDVTLNYVRLNNVEKICRCVSLNHPGASLSNVALQGGYIESASNTGVFGSLLLVSQGTASNIMATAGYAYGSDAMAAVALMSSQAVLTHSKIYCCTNSDAYLHGDADLRISPTAVYCKGGRMENVLVRDCVQQELFGPGGWTIPVGTAVFLLGGATMVNCTVVDCASGLVGGVYVKDSASKVYNTVVAGCTIPKSVDEKDVLLPSAFGFGSGVSREAALFSCAADDITESVEGTLLAGTRETFFADFETFAPGDALANKGATDVPGGLPATDYAGRVRVFSSAPDIGYLERVVPGFRVSIR